MYSPLTCARLSATQRSAIVRYLAGLAFASCLPANAGALAVSPLKLVYTNTSGIVAVSVQNDGTDEALVQAETFLWKQIGGEHSLSPTEDVIAVPPVFKLAPGAQQSVRVGLTRAFDEKREQTFRLTITEVPTTVAQGGVAVAVRHSLPIFVRPASPMSPKLSAKIHAGSVEIGNSGSQHLRIHRWRLRDSSGAVVAQGSGPGYLLAGASQLLPVGKRSQPGPTVFEADCDDGTLKTAAGQ